MIPSILFSKILTKKQLKTKTRNLFPIFQRNFHKSIKNYEKTGNLYGLIFI